MLTKKNLKMLLILLICAIAITGCADNQGESFQYGSTINQDGSAELESNVDQDDLTELGEDGNSDSQSNSAGPGEPDGDEVASSAAVLSMESSSKGKNGQTEFAFTKNAETNPNNDGDGYYCTISITCKTILDNMDDFDRAKLEVLPEDGIIYQSEKVEFNQGDSAFDVLLRGTRANRIHMEFVETPIYKSAYIEGINNIYEFDAGPLSGWMYKVNGIFPNHGSSRYQLKDGDIVEWIYTCDLGDDIGGDWNEQNSKKD